MQNKNVNKVPVDVVKTVNKINKLIDDELFKLDRIVEHEESLLKIENTIYKEVIRDRIIQILAQKQGLLKAQALIGKIIVGDVKFDEVEV